MAIHRGCGTRVQGGVYAVAAQCSITAKHCHPYQEFLCDPPVPVAPERMGLSHIGTKMVGNIIFDWVGEKYYPNVADLLAEACFVDPATGRPAGFSRRLANWDASFWSQLTPNTMLALIHSRGSVLNAEVYFRQEPSRGECEEVLDDNAECSQLVGWGHCRRRVKEPVHSDRTDLGLEGRRDACTLCARVWWQDVAGGEALGQRSVTRKMPGGTYTAFRKPEGVIPVYAPAVIGRFPLRLEVVHDPRGSHVETMRKIMGSTDVPVRLVSA